MTSMRLSNSLGRKFLAMMAIALFGLTAFARTAFAQDLPPPPQVQSVGLERGYVLGQGDKLEVAVLGREDYRVQTQVQVDGTIQLPLIGNVQVADRTVLEARDLIRDQLRQGGYFTDPAVSLIVVGYSSRYVNVFGQVKSPGNVTIDRVYRLSDILATVGGVTPAAADSVIVTNENGSSYSVEIELIATGGPEYNPTVLPGDRIFVAEAPKFYVSGAVNAPGVYRLEPGMTLRMALARSGGVSPRGSSRRVTIFRDGEELKKFDKDAPLRADDNIYVKESFF